MTGIGKSRSRTTSLFVIGLLVVLANGPRQLPGLGAQGPSKTEQIDRAQLEAVEELSESLANDLVELSIATRDRDLARTAEFLPARLRATPLPSRPSSFHTQIKWIGIRAWNSPSSNASAKAATGGLRQMTEAEFLRGWSEFLAHFAEIEDARFKVKQASFDEPAAGANGPIGRARIAFFVIGRNTDGQREWARGAADIVARRPATGRWQIEHFALVSLDSMVSTTELFVEVSAPAGVAATRPAYGSSGNSGFTWYGAAAGDFNNDGWVDLFVTAPDRNYLYLNDAKGRFGDVAEETGAKFSASGTAPLVLDYDNDGDQDVFISAVGPQVLLENRLIPDGRLDFRDVSLEAGVAVQAIGFSAAAGDVNGDGRPDIYVACYNRYGQIAPNSWLRATNGTPNLLFVNQGNGRFREEARQWRVDDDRWSYAAAFADVNSDGRLDLYVANDFGENGLFINQGDHFEDEAKKRGALDPGYGMGVSFGDYNNDGRLDLHVTNMSSTAGNRILSRLYPTSSAKDNTLKKMAAGNNLYQNTGHGVFTDVTEQVGGFSGGWAWGGGFIDFDNDGWEDLFTPNGFISGKSMKDT